MATDANVNFDSLLMRRIAPPPLTAGVTSWNGLTGAVKGTLAEIYSFGLGDSPLVDNIFAMVGGNRRWATSSGTWETVADAFFEKAAGPLPDSRVGVWSARRTVDASTTGTTFVTASLYDLTAVGDPVPDGRSWITWRGQSAFDLSETGFNGNFSWGEQYDATRFFSGLPVAIPTADPAVGGRITKVETLYAEAAGGAAAFTARTLSGWGQENVFTIAQTAAITPSFMGWYNPASTGDAIGNGVGAFFGAGDPVRDRTDRLRGGIESHMLAADYLGDWGTGLWAYDSVIPGLVKVADFDPHAITFQVPLTPPVYTDTSTPVRSWAFGGAATAIPIDLTVTGQYQIIPHQGFRFAFVQQYFVVKTATAVTVSPTFSVGTIGPGFANFCGSQTPATTQWVAGGRQSPTIAVVAIPDLSTSGLVLNVTGAATATALVAEYYVFGVLVPV